MINISENVEILNMIYQGSHTAVNSLSAAAENIVCPNLKRDFQGLMEQYYNMSYFAEKELHYLGQEPVDLNPYEKVGRWADCTRSGAVGTLYGKTEELILNGSKVMIEEVLEKISKSNNVLPNVRNLAECFVGIGKKHIKFLSEYL